MLERDTYNVQRTPQVLEEGTEEMVTAVEQGEVIVSTAAEIATLTEEEQKEVVCKGRKARKRKHP